MTHPWECVADLNITHGDLLPNPFMARMIPATVRRHRGFVERHIASVYKIEEYRRAESPRKPDKEVA